MDVELKRTYPVSLQRGFEFFKDVRTWSDWTVLSIADPETAAWNEPGDEVRYSYRPPIPGFTLPGVATLDELIPDELIRMTLTGRGLPPMPVECRFDEAGPGAFTLRLRVHTDPPAGFFGDGLERLFWFEGFVARDMKRCLEQLEAALTQPAVVAGS